MKPLRNEDPSAIGPYRLLGRLGAGGMGRVYLAVSRSGRKVALKVIHEELADDPDFRKRFAREVEAARAVSALFTASVVDADTTSASPWCATTYIGGPTLTDRVLDDGPFSVSQTLILAAGLAEALAGIHRAGLIHRDLKPGNVMLTDIGPQVIDFGIALAVARTRMTRSVILGTPAYMAPERLLGEADREASDIFALGACLVFAATGHGVVSEDLTNAQVGQILSGRLDLTGVPKVLRPLIQLCLAREPKARPTAREVLNILLASRAPSPEPGWYLPVETNDNDDHRVRLPRRRLRRRDMLLLSIGGAAVLGTGGWLQFGAGRTDKTFGWRDPLEPRIAWDVAHEYPLPLERVAWMQVRALKGKQVVFASDKRRLIAWDPDETEAIMDTEAETADPDRTEPGGFASGVVKVAGKLAAIYHDYALDQQFAIDITTGKRITQVYASPPGGTEPTLLLVFQDGDRPVAFGGWTETDGVFHTGFWRLDTGQLLDSSFLDDTSAEFRSSTIGVANEIAPYLEEPQRPKFLCQITIAGNPAIFTKTALGKDSGTVLFLPPDDGFSFACQPLTDEVTNQLAVLTFLGLSAWDVSTRKQTFGPFIPDRELLPMLAACSLPQLAVVAATGAGELLLWNPATGTQMGEFHHAHQGPVLGLATIGSGQQQRAVSAGADGKLKIWKIQRV